MNSAVECFHPIMGGPANACFKALSLCSYPHQRTVRQPCGPCQCSDAFQTLLPAAIAARSDHCAAILQRPGPSLPLLLLVPFAAFLTQAQAPFLHVADFKAIRRGWDLRDTQSGSPASGAAWRSLLAIIAAVARHRKGFRLFWTRKVRHAIPVAVHHGSTVSSAGQPGGKRLDHSSIASSACSFVSRCGCSRRWCHPRLGRGLRHDRTFC